MADDLVQYEDVVRRRKPSVRASLTIWTRTYNFPREAVADLLPAKGTAVDLTGLATQTDSVLRYRVLDSREMQTAESGKIRVEIDFYQIRAYA